MSNTESQPLDGVRVALLIAPKGTEEPEFTDPKRAVSEAGGTVDVVGIDTGEAETVNNDLDPGGSYEVDEPLAEVSADDYDALVIPGGTVGADILRTDEDAVGLIQDHVAAGKPLGVICHGPWTLVEADVVDGRTLTSYPSLQTDVRNAGGEWVDEEVVVDQGIVTSRNPNDLPVFCDAIIEEFATS